MKTTCEEFSQPLFVLIVHSIAKKINIGNLIRSACAFNIHSVLIAGSKKNVQFFGSQGTFKHIDFINFDSLEGAVKHARSNLKCEILGIEIRQDAKSINTEPFKGNTAFILGNEGTGLSEKQASYCDNFIYIPQYGTGTASLNVAISGSIVFHRFASWAKYKETERVKEKYLITPAKDTIHKKRAERVRAERNAKKLKEAKT